jgi:hypothetical protein
MPSKTKLANYLCVGGDDDNILGITMMFLLAQLCRPAEIVPALV